MAANVMKSVSMLELRLHAEKIIGQVQKGERLILTRRGKPVARLEPIRRDKIDLDDPFYALGDLSVKSGKSLSNNQIDDIVYGS